MTGATRNKSNNIHISFFIILYPINHNKMPADQPIG